MTVHTPCCNKTILESKQPVCATQLFCWFSLAFDQPRYKAYLTTWWLSYFKAIGRVAQQGRLMTNDRSARMGLDLVNDSHGHFEHQLSFSRIHIHFLTNYIVVQTSCSLKTLWNLCDPQPARKWTFDFGFTSSSSNLTCFCFRLLDIASFSIFSGEPLLLAFTPLGGRLCFDRAAWISWSP